MLAEQPGQTGSLQSSRNKKSMETSNMNKPWFGPRKYGFGLTPIRWQGWMCVLLIVAVFSGFAVMFGQGANAF